MLFEKHIYILTLEMASPRNQHSEAFENQTRATTQETQKVVYFWILKKNVEKHEKRIRTVSEAT